MNKEPSPGDFEQPSSPDNSKSSAAAADGSVWSAISTLVAGPTVWGGIGVLLDKWLETPRVFSAGGVIVGFITSLYIVYIRFGRD